MWWMSISESDYTRISGYITDKDFLYRISQQLETIFAIPNPAISYATPCMAIWKTQNACGAVNILNGRVISASVSSRQDCNMHLLEKAPCF